MIYNSYQADCIAKRCYGEMYVTRRHWNCVYALIVHCTVLNISFPGSHCTLLARWTNQAIRWLDYTSQTNASERLSDCQYWKNQTPEIQKRAFDDEDRQDDFLDRNGVIADGGEVLFDLNEVEISWLPVHFLKDSELHGSKWRNVVTVLHCPVHGL